MGGFTTRRTVPFGQRPPLRFATHASWPRRFAASASPRCRGRLDRPRQLGLGAWCGRGLAATAVASSAMGGFTARRTVPFGQRPPLRFAPLRPGLAASRRRPVRAAAADWIGHVSWSLRLVRSRPGRDRSRVESHGWLHYAAWPLRQSRRVPWGLSLRNGRDPGFVAARHWLGGGVRYSGWKSSKRLTGGSDTRSRVPGHRGSVGFLVGVMECCARTVSCVGGGWR